MESRLVRLHALSTPSSLLAGWLGRLTRHMAPSLAVANFRLAPDASASSCDPLQSVLLSTKIQLVRKRCGCIQVWWPGAAGPSLRLQLSTSFPAPLTTSALQENIRSTAFHSDKSREVVHKQTDDDTIAAIVTSMGGQAGAVAIIRLSGLSAVAIASQIFRPARRSGKGSGQKALWEPSSHFVEYGTLVDSTGALVDEVLLVPMLAPRSYTREDVVELQCHGGDICARRVLQICLESGARLAQPGEFTLRAFLNGRLDLAQAENVAQVIAAKTSLAADTALAGVLGGLSSVVQSLRKECIDLLVEMEARLDFDEDMPVLDIGLLIKRITTMERGVEQALATTNRGRLLQSGLQVAIVGRPNVGKSSLLNAWSQSERAIVTDVPGTTRDVVEARIVVGGLSVILLDTAGIRETHDIVESIGVRRSEAAARGADVVLMVIDALDGWTVEDGLIFQQIQGCFQTQRTSGARGLAGSMTLSTETSLASQLPTTGSGRPAILIINKVDQRAPVSVQLPDEVAVLFHKVVFTCAPQRIGLESLEQALLHLVELGEVSSEGLQWAVNQRQAEQFIRARDALCRLKDSILKQLPLDFWTIDLKEAAIAMGEISGDDVSEEVLSNVFSKFCIGK